jgi:chemotaxis signal transduction protein
VSFFRGIGKSGEKLVVLLDMDRLLSESDLQEVSTTVTA